jgi:hypothetical protein
MNTGKFRLSETFIDGYKHKRPNWGFNGLGELVYFRTYSRLKDDDTNERWWETVLRVVEGTYNLQKDTIDKHGLEWNAWKAQKSAQEMYDRIFSFKFLPPGRGLFAMGSKLTEEKKLYACLNNCAFISTKNVAVDYSKPFAFMMDMSMLGVGVGFDILGADTLEIKAPDSKKEIHKFQIPDSREGWVESLRTLLDSYFFSNAVVEFDYSIIRPAGLRIKTFGGITSGPEPLKKMHVLIRKVLDNRAGKKLTGRDIADIMNMICCCVVSGNVRRSASVIFGDANNNEYLDLKNKKVFPEREDWSWASNNSIYAMLGMNYHNVCERTKANGEPGFLWLENLQIYSRMVDPIDNKDFRAVGANPCLIGSTKVITDRGELTILEILDIINKKEPLLALSYDIENKKIEFTPITNAFLTKEKANVIKI